MALPVHGEIYHPLCTGTAIKLRNPAVRF